MFASIKNCTANHLSSRYLAVIDQFFNIKSCISHLTLTSTI